MLTHEERCALLEHARHTLMALLSGAHSPAPPQLSSPFAHSGAFVTLEVEGELRGCIGFPGASAALTDVVADAARAAATEDPRFPPVRAAELPRLRIEISVLTPIEPVTDLGTIEVGRDGLVAEQGYRRGLLLPQVASEYAWTREEFLSHTCMKAGLRPDAWRTGASISRFQAEVFGEGE
jgi:AmmeMemoRadiSam system protein A